MKRIISLLLICISLFSLTACGSNPKKAFWEGYNEMNFAEFLNTYIKQVHKASDEDIDVSFKKGWSGSELLDDDDATNGTVPYTCKAYVQSNLYFTFYVEYDKDNNTLSARGAYIDGEEIGEKQANGWLHLMEICIG